MQKDEIALQLTLKAIEKMHVETSHCTVEESNSNFSKQVCDFYNYLYKNLNDTIEI